MAMISNRNGSFIDNMNEDKCYSYGGYVIDDEQLIVELYRFVFVNKKHYSKEGGHKQITLTGTPESVYEDMSKLTNNGVATPMPKNMLMAP